MGPTWGRQDPGGPMLAPWSLLSGVFFISFILYLLEILHFKISYFRWMLYSVDASTIISFIKKTLGLTILILTMWWIVRAFMRVKIKWHVDLWSLFCRVNVLNMSRSWFSVSCKNIIKWSKWNLWSDITSTLNTHIKFAIYVIVF